MDHIAVMRSMTYILFIGQKIYLIYIIMPGLKTRPK